jgi:hypothetical protein
MTEQQTGQPQEGEQGEQTPKTFDAEYVDKLRKEAAKYRTEAKANAEAAKRLQDLEESQKSEQQKAEDRITALEREIAESRLAASRAQIATQFKLSEKQAAALKYAPSEEAAREIAEGLAAESEERKKNGNHVPREGETPKPGADEGREFVRGLFGRANAD